MFDMDNKKDEDRAGEYMRLTIPLMNKHGISVTPENYTVWYSYVSGSNDDLRKAIDLHIEENTQITDQQSKALYEQFFDQKQEKLTITTMRKELKRVLATILEFTATSASASQDISENLSEIITKLHPEMTQPEIHNAIKDVLNEAQLIMNSSDVLSEQLNATILEVEELKKDIDNAKRDAKIDTLTKLANKVTFESELEKTTINADSVAIEVCMIFGDLDLFKNINDKHGYIVGDQVLRVVANSLKKAVKARDLVARYNGEEFAILLPNTSLTNAKNIAETMRSEIASKRIQRRDSREPLGTITMSFGVARYYQNEGAESFLQRTDRALYISKRNGRNRVSEAPAPVI